MILGISSNSTLINRKKGGFIIPRIARLIVKDESAVYHVMSRTTLDGYVIGNVEKQYMLELIKKLSKVFFTEVLSLCIMGNHFHLLVRMYTGEEYSDEMKSRDVLPYIMVKEANRN